MGDRLRGLKKCLHDWNVEVMLINSAAAELAYEKYNQYVKLSKESCNQYDDMKKAFQNIFGVTVVQWLVMYTNFFVRDSIMLRKNLKDKVTESTTELINDWMQPETPVTILPEIKIVEE